MTRADWEESSANWQALYQRECDRREALERRVQAETTLRDEYKEKWGRAERAFQELEAEIEEWQCATLHETPDEFQAAQAVEDGHWNALVDQKERWRRKARKGRRARAEAKRLRTEVRGLVSTYESYPTYHLFERLHFTALLDNILEPKEKR